MLGSERDGGLYLHRPVDTRNGTAAARWIAHKIMTIQMGWPYAHESSFRHSPDFLMLHGHILEDELLSFGKNIYLCTQQ